MNIEKLLRVVPSKKQERIQNMKFYAFIHFGMNTFTDVEWGNGKEDPLDFSPRKKVNTDKWVKLLKKAGAKGVILTAKHHDGFCLWQTSTTEHSIKNAKNYLNGRGDIVRSLSESCKKYNFPMGLYLSPWDMNSKYYKTDRYNDFYITQLKELLSNYGPVFMLWLDGACGWTENGIPMQEYDFARIWNEALKLQPEILLANEGPDVRWVGNEAGKGRVAEWCVFPKCEHALNDYISPKKAKNPKYAKRSINRELPDLGSREFLSNYDEFMWYPAEADVSIRPGWFYHKSEDDKVKSLDKLISIYNNTVGANTLLLLNLAPDKKGEIPKPDTSVLLKLGKYIKRYDKNEIRDAIVDEITKNDIKEYAVSFKEDKIDRVVLSEDLTKSQRVEEFSILHNNEVIYKSTTIGFSKIAIFDEIQTDNLVIRIDKSRGEPDLKDIKIIKSKNF